MLSHKRSSKKPGLLAGVRRPRLVVAVAAAIVFSAVVVVPSPAANPPPRFTEPLAIEAFPTGAQIKGAGFHIEVSPNPATQQETHWKLELAEEETGPWKVVESGVVFDVGTVLSGEATHLTPEKTYYARVRAENSSGEVVTPAVKFTTKPISAPEFNYFVGPQEDRHTTSIQALSYVKSNGAETKYVFEYSQTSNGPYAIVPGSEGTVSVAEDYKHVEIDATGLAPETTYYFRGRASNHCNASKPTEECSTASPIISVATTPLHPIVSISAQQIRNVTATSAHVAGEVDPQTFQTSWRFETGPAENGPWTAVPGGSGLISSAEADENHHEVSANITGLKPGTKYYVRLVAENGHEPDGISVESFETEGAPVPVTLAVHSLDGEAVRLLGTVDPRTARTSDEQLITVEGAPTGGTFTLTFDGQTTAPIPYDAGDSEVDNALEGLSGIGKAAINGRSPIGVEGPAGGPYAVFFFGLGEVSEPQISGNGSGLTPSGSVTVNTLQQGGEGYETHYSFQYASQQAFAKNGWAEAQQTPEVAFGLGGARTVSEDVPGLTGGETYRYRLVASNTTPGNPVVEGAEQVLTAPMATGGESRVACPNESVRTGPSAQLPDCRAFEQISPVDKEGAQEALKYGLAIETGAIASEDGEHFMFMSDATRWGTAASSGQAPYFFARTADGWRMTPGAPQPQAGYDRYRPLVFSPDLSQFGLRVGWSTGGEELEGAIESPDVEFQVGSGGGPYTVAASVPRKQLGAGGGWVAVSADFSKLVLAVADRELVEGSRTGTTSGNDLYEYSGGELRQLNVDSTGATIGKCGAQMANGREASGQDSSAHAVSADGSRVFFEAVPGSSCGEAKHLFMREAAAGRTVDIGAYTFEAASSDGSRVLLGKQEGEGMQFLLYDVESASAKPLFSLAKEPTIAVSENLAAIYLLSGPSLYRYDIEGQKLAYVDEVVGADNPGIPSPDGRYDYFEARGVAGVPSGGTEPGQEPGEKQLSRQLYRFDSSDEVLTCVSCASPFDPEPKLPVDNTGGTLEGRWQPANGAPRETFASGDGNYAFFVTASALVAGDDNGEVPPEPSGSERVNGTPSNDVYEWRANGVDGCGRLAGCVTLITPGRDGYLVSLLGTTDSGRDVFFYTSSQLVPQDNDSAGDFYDARIDGGFPEAPKPSECEGNACLAPLAAPLDATPASLSFTGPGNLTPSITPPSKTTKKKPAKKTRKTKRKKAKAKRKQDKRTGKKAEQGNRGRGR
jgi:hypothetical protein